MKLQSLQLYDFRNYETASVSFHPGVNLIVGENAQGKTNLLEAVFICLPAKAFAPPAIRNSSASAQNLQT